MEQNRASNVLPHHGELARTARGLALHAELDVAIYETGKTVSDEQMRLPAIKRCDFHGEWNYSLSPRNHKAY
jgi:hypothetical protein